MSAYAEHVLDALGDPTRRMVLKRLRGGARSVGEIAKGMDVSRPAVSQHLKVLKAARLVVARAEGTRRLYAIDTRGLETWLRIAGVPYEVVDTPDPRKGPKGKLPFIEDAGVRIADTSLIVEHLVKTRGVDPDAHLDTSQRATALLPLWPDLVVQGYVSVFQALVDRSSKPNARVRLAGNGLSAPGKRKARYLAEGWLR